MSLAGSRKLTSIFASSFSFSTAIYMYTVHIQTKLCQCQLTTCNCIIGGSGGKYCVQMGGNCARSCFLLYPLRDVQLKPRLSFPERQAKTSDSVNELLHYRS